MSLLLRSDDLCGILKFSEGSEFLREDFKYFGTSKANNSQNCPEEPCLAPKNLK